VSGGVVGDGQKGLMGFMGQGSLINQTTRVVQNLTSTQKEWKTGHSKFRGHSG